MDLMSIGISLLTKQFSGGVSEGQASSALSGLLGDGSGGLDIAGLIANLSGNGDLGNVIGSWLGDGANEGINPGQLLEMFGGDKLSEFAGSLGLDQESATQGLSNILPQLIDQGSEGGNLLESAGGIGGVLDIAKKLF